MFDDSDKGFISYVALTHLPLVAHICVNELGQHWVNNSLSPGRRQAIIWTNAEILSIALLGTNFSETRIAIRIFIQENAFEIAVCQNGGHFAQGEMS